MTTFRKLKKISAVAMVLGIVALGAVQIKALVDYRFKVHNKASSRLTKLLASPDGKKYAFFDVGKGIAPGATVEFVWDQSTDNSNCEWYLKAVFADGGESDPKQFDFCEKDLVVEFSD